MHIIWDWNGTLLDDLELVVESVSAAIAPYGADPITPDQYRHHYTRPVDIFYERLLARPIGRQEWLELDAAFHDHYREGLPSVGLAEGAWLALERASNEGFTQSLLSMFPHDELVPLVSRHAVEAFMLRVEGLRGPAGTPKTDSLDGHLRALSKSGVDRGVIIMIGDALDDASAAADVGVRCVLLASGSHHRSELEATGVPVADTLGEAVTLVGA